jgi:hypothetical protein
MSIAIWTDRLRSPTGLTFRQSGQKFRGNFSAPKKWLFMGDNWTSDAEIIDRTELPVHKGGLDTTNQASV